MIRAGLTGGYATGKSFVASELAHLGCHVIYADQLGHEALEPGGAAFEPALQTFGRQLLGPDGRIDRKQLAAIVFESAESLAALTALVHPAVFRREQELTDAFALANPDGIVIYEAAILIETGRHSSYDRVIVTDADEETQIARGMRRDHATRSQVLARIGRQLSREEKRKQADFVIDTSGTKESTVRQVHEVYRQLRHLSTVGEN